MAALQNDWHLVDCWANAAEGEDLLQLLDGEVADANVFHQTLHAHSKEGTFNHLRSTTSDNSIGSCGRTWTAVA